MDFYEVYEGIDQNYATNRAKDIKQPSTHTSGRAMLGDANHRSNFTIAEENESDYNEAHGDETPTP